MFATRPQSGNQDVILVDELDREIGIEAKLQAHKNGGKLHRAFSIFLVNARGQMLLQQRSQRKYHFGGLWTNACCSHPRPGETLEFGAAARLREELGIQAELREAFGFIYRADDPVSGLTEHEFDHVFIGRFDGTPVPNPDEVDDWAWVEIGALQQDLLRRPARYTPWFQIAMERVAAFLPVTGTEDARGGNTEKDD